jgi:peptide/nickel transport system permease protein
MARFAIRRLVSTLFVLVAISILTFLIFQAIPNGDPALRLVGRTSNPETIAAVRKSWGFDKPIWNQYIITMHKVLTGKVISYTQQIKVISQIRQGLPATVSLAVGSSVIWLFLSIVFGMFSAIKAGRFSDRALTVLALTGISTPVFVLGAVALYVLAYLTHVFPNGGYVPFTQSPWQWLYHLILPWLTLAVLFIGFYSRILRSNVLDTMGEDFVRTARAKGLSERRVLVRHVLRTSLIPIISLWGLDFAGVVGGGAILTEQVFNLHGVGQYAAQSIGALDVPPVLVIVMFGAFAVVVMSAVIDVVYAFLDPRIRLSG